MIILGVHTQAENNMKGGEKDEDPKKERTGQTSQA
jgi:hypothetical protein